METFSQNTERPAAAGKAVSTWFCAAERKPSRSGILAVSLQREADVILGEALRRRTRADDVVELRVLTASIECVVVLVSMQHRVHPPREALHLPDPPQTNFRVAIEQ